MIIEGLIPGFTLGAEHDYWNGGSKNCGGGKQYGTLRAVFLAIDDIVFQKLFPPRHISVDMEPDEYHWCQERPGCYDYRGFRGNDIGGSGV